MKQHLRRFTATLLATALLATSALASVALGDELHGYTVPLAEGAALTTQLFWSHSKSDLRTENYISYQPNASLSPKVSYGNTVLQKQTVPAMAKALEQQGKRVLSGINGDYFVMATGDPLGLVVTDGILRSSPSHLDAVGFLPDGSAIIGKPQLTINAHMSDMTLKVAEVNKVRTNTGFYLLSSDFATSTQNTKPGIDVVLAPVAEDLGSTVTNEEGQALTLGNSLKIGGRMRCVVEQVIDSPTVATEIPAGKFVLTVNRSADAFLVETLAAQAVGNIIEIDITTPDTRWNQVDSAIGAMYAIATNGKVNSGLDDTAAPRTAVGVKADGSVIFYTIDGRQSGLSVGASMTQVATRLLELGCINAVCLDGGGSTTFGVTDPGSNGFEVVNSPSEGSLRSVTNALFLVSNLSASGQAARLFVEPKERVLLSGGSTTVQSSLVDSNWHPMTGNEALQYKAEKGTVSPEGLYTAPPVDGIDTITVTSASGLVGTTTVTVFQSPTAISLSNEATGKKLSSLTLEAKETVDLRASAVHKMIPLAATDTAFRWSVAPSNLGTITPDGVFTAGSVNGTGQITITAGSHQASIPLAIASDAKIQRLEDFEIGDQLSFQSGNGGVLSLYSANSPKFNADYLRYGRQSLRFDYDLTAGEVQLTGSFPLEKNLSHLSLWVYGDKSATQLSATVRDESDVVHNVTFGVIDFSGWKRLTAVLPENARYLSGLTLSGSATTGSLWLDQLTAANQLAEDTTAPTLTLSLRDGQVLATAEDNNSLPFGEENFSYTVDGIEGEYTYLFDPSTATLTGDLPVDDALHRVAVELRDHAGNITRVSVSVGTAVNSSFLDMKGHWAENYTAYLADQGIVQGEAGKNGYNFAPNRSITRGDFALMVARFLDLDMTIGEMPFVDANKIPEWSKGAVYALNQRGIMQGSATENGLYAKAGEPITRAEAMTILGRIQPKGHSEASLTAFTDASEIPTWAKSHLAVLVKQEVVGGFEGKLRPGDSVSRAELCKMLFALR